MNATEAAPPGGFASVVWIELGMSAIGIRTDQLLAIRAADSAGASEANATDGAAVDDEPPFDLDERFESSIDSARPQRVLELVGDVRFSTRAQVIVDDDAAERTHRLPAFLERWGETHGVCAMTSRDSGFGWIIEQSTFVAQLRTNPGLPVFRLDDDAVDP